MRKIAIFLLLLVSVTILFPAEDETVALINKIIRTVEFKSGEEDWQKAKVGKTLIDNDLVRTGEKSLAIISFLDGSLLRVRENTEVAIYGDKKKRELNKNVLIDKGVIGFDVKKQQNEEFKFTTPTLVASIRGTAGFIEVDGDGSTTFALETGLVSLEASSGAKQSSELTPGNTATVGADGVININPTTGEIERKIKESKRTKIKKLRIQTEKGVIEIEYYSDN
ncbi:MAG: hypothetical protein SCALA702_18970 [Melioribacteraceae bacterium]|nr:MAG: hypothetical protein SCALA702_18970 [Melioribacteraceae bacterium]